MDFDYALVTDWPKHKPHQRYLPWINIGIRKFGGKEIVNPLGLIDSGADITIVDREIGEELGFNFKKAKSDFITGFGGAKVDVFILDCEYIIDDNKGKQPIIYRDLIGFVQNQFPNSHPQQTAIFGTIGLFRNVSVTFDFPRNIHIEQMRLK